MAGSPRARAHAALLLVAIAILSGCAPSAQTGGSSPSVSVGPPSATAPATTAPSPTPAITGLVGHILFTRAGGAYGDETVFVADADGTGEQRLSEFGRGEGPWATRDGSRIVFFFVLPDGRGTAVTERLDGSDRVVLPLPTGTLNLGSGPISPDGTQLVLFLGPDGDPPPAGSLWIVFLDGTGLRQLTPEASQVGCCMNYRWSPDGSRILFADAAGVLWTIAPDGWDLTQVFRDGSGRYAITPTWSPDGSMIMFALDPTPNPFAHPVNGLYVIRADGSALTEVIATNDFKREPVWVSR